MAQSFLLCIDEPTNGCLSSMSGSQAGKYGANRFNCGIGATRKRLGAFPIVSTLYNVFPLDEHTPRDTYTLFQDEKEGETRRLRNALKVCVEWIKLERQMSEVRRQDKLSESSQLFYPTSSRPKRPCLDFYPSQNKRRVKANRKRSG